MPWTNKTGMAKIAAFLSVLAMGSAGLCGVNFVAVVTIGGKAPVDKVLMVTAIVECVGIAAGVAGLILVAAFVLVMKLADSVRARRG